jgi:hypothetical protein
LLGVASRRVAADFDSPKITQVHLGFVGMFVIFGLAANREIGVRGGTNLKNAGVGELFPNNPSRFSDSF